jgi:hypothetical protein
LSDKISRHPAGADMEKLQQAYAVAAVKRAAARKHQVVRSRALADGAIELTVSV